MSTRTSQGIGTQLLHQKLLGSAPAFDLNRAVAQQGQQNDLQTRRLMNSFGHQGKPIRRRDMRGNVIDDVAGQPTGLDGFYANNPNVIPGQFDPTGSLAQGRTQTQADINDLGLLADQAFAEGQLGIADAFREGAMGGFLPVQQDVFAGPPVGAQQFNQQAQNFEDINTTRNEVSKLAGLVELLMSEMQGGSATIEPSVSTPVAPIPEASINPPGLEVARTNSLAGPGLAEPSFVPDASPIPGAVMSPDDVTGLVTSLLSNAGSIDNAGAGSRINPAIDEGLSLGPVDIPEALPVVGSPNMSPVPGASMTSNDVTGLIKTLLSGASGTSNMRPDFSSLRRIQPDLNLSQESDVIRNRHFPIRTPDNLGSQSAPSFGPVPFGGQAGLPQSTKPIGYSLIDILLEKLF